MKQFFFWCPGLFLVLHAIPSSSQHELAGSDDFTKITNNEEWKIVNEKISPQKRTILKREIISSRREIDANTIGCSRYCVRRRILDGTTENDSLKRVNIIWNIVNETRVTLTGESSPNWGASSRQEEDLQWEYSYTSTEKSNIDRPDNPKCELYIKLGCESYAESNSNISTISDTFSNSDQKKLVSVSHAVGQSSTVFNVNDVTEKLTIFVLGKLSQAILEIPIEVTFTNERDELEVNSNKALSRPQRLAYLRANNDNNAERVIKSTGEQLPVVPHLANNSEVAASSLPREMKFFTKFSRKANLEAELMEPEIGSIMNIEDPDENARIFEDSEFDELSRVAADIQSTRSRTIVDLSPSTELIARPGNFHDIIFTVKNGQTLGIRHAFKGSSSQFPYIGVDPPVSWIRPGETINVIVRIHVPNVQDSAANTVTLYVGGNENFEVVEKSTYVYVQGSSGLITTDNDKPNIDYSFNDNCAGKLHRDRCARSRWSVDITANDPDSGLKRVSSLPSGVQPRTEFIAGTRNIVSFYYTATCCETTVDITATDVQGNSYTRTIDVTAWDNLTQGEIAAIIVGALLILVLIILIILIAIYCFRKRKSHDLSYSQRYGSRTPASAERTNF